MPPKAKGGPKPASSLAKAGSSILSSTLPKAKAKSKSGNVIPGENSGKIAARSDITVANTNDELSRSEGKAAKVLEEVERTLEGQDTNVSVEKLDNVTLPANYHTVSTDQDRHEKELKENQVMEDNVDEGAQQLAALADGEVIVKYSMYSERFPIKSHKLDAQRIDELYCLTDVMPGCRIHLSDHEFGYGEERMYLAEDPIGTFVGLLANETYWCYVEQDAEEQKKDQERCRKAWKGGVASGIGDRDLGNVRCTCCEGVPCSTAQKNVCLDWEHRLAVAEKARRPLAAGLAT